MIEQNYNEPPVILVTPEICSGVFELQNVRLQNFDDVTSTYSNQIANCANITATVKVFKNTFPPYFNEEDIPTDDGFDEEYPSDEDLEEEEQIDIDDITQVEDSIDPLQSPEIQKEIEREETEGNANPEVHKAPVE
jgi:hypothetical protein